MARRTALALGVTMILALWACGNGESTAGTGSGGGSDGSGGAGTCGTCADVFTNGGVACGGTASDTALEALRDCACIEHCVGPCGSSLCEDGPSDAMCGACLEASCAAQTMDCAAN